MLIGADCILEIIRKLDYRDASRCAFVSKEFESLVWLLHLRRYGMFPQLRTASLQYVPQLYERYPGLIASISPNQFSLCLNRIVQCTRKLSYAKYSATNPNVFGVCLSPIVVEACEVELAMEERKLAQLEVLKENNYYDLSQCKHLPFCLRKEGGGAKKNLGKILAAIFRCIAPCAKKTKVRSNTRYTAAKASQSR